MRALVAILDGERAADGTAFAPGALCPTPMVVPILRQFDPLHIVGFARLAIEGDRLYADLSTATWAELVGFYPALGGRAIDQHGTLITSFVVSCLGVSITPNADPRIPPIARAD